jgi:hypothetical protein
MYNSRVELYIFAFEADFARKWQLQIVQIGTQIVQFDLKISPNAPLTTWQKVNVGVIFLYHPYIPNRPRCHRWWSRNLVSINTNHLTPNHG